MDKTIRVIVLMDDSESEINEEFNYRKKANSDFLEGYNAGDSVYGDYN